MNYKRYELGDICQISAGGDRPEVCSDVKTDITPIPIFSNGMENDGLYGYTDKAKIEGDVVTISARGVNVGTVCYRSEPFMPIVRLLSLVPDRKIVDAKYLYYVLKNTVLSGTGSAQPQITAPMIKKQEVVVLEEMKEQLKVADFLSMLDEKICLNKKINDNLLQQAKLLYKDRFVDMTPFNGVMPNDWHEGTVSEIIELHDSQRIPLSSRERADLAKIYPYYGATSVMDYVDRYLFDGIYLLLGEDGTVVDAKGFPILQYVEGKFWVNNHAHIITGKNGFSVELLYLLFSMTNVQSIVTGAVQPKISQANLNKVPVVIPSMTELQSFDSIVQPIFSQMRNLRSENDRLANIRDTLLPRLMSGELDVSNLDI
jgi:type I restriction enzyme S subunit